MVKGEETNGRLKYTEVEGFCWDMGFGSLVA
jgi:hypothetical protein